MPITDREGCKLSVGLVMDATFYIHFLMGSNRWREQEIIINESGEEKKDFCITGLDWIGLDWKSCIYTIRGERK